MTPRNIFIIFILILFACNNSRHKENSRINEIKKISFATAGCYGKCPFIAIEIDSNLSYKFYGGQYAEKQGFFKGIVTQNFWDTLNLKFEQIKYKQLDTLYNSSVDDMPIESYITYEQKRKPLYGQEMSIPDSVREVLYWIMNSYKHLNLTQVDTLTFETSIQYGSGPIPPPKILKFTPPKFVE